MNQPLRTAEARPSEHPSRLPGKFIPHGISPDVRTHVRLWSLLSSYLTNFGHDPGVLSNFLQLPASPAAATLLILVAQQMTKGRADLNRLKLRSFGFQWVMLLDGWWEENHQEKPMIISCSKIWEPMSQEWHGLHLPDSPTLDGISVQIWSYQNKIRRTYTRINNYVDITCISKCKLAHLNITMFFLALGVPWDRGVLDGSSKQ